MNRSWAVPRWEPVGRVERGSPRQGWHRKGGPASSNLPETGGRDGAGYFWQAWVQSDTWRGEKGGWG